jgi:hypothetical protein
MSTIGYASTHRIVIYFKGVFQDRLATDLDPSDEKRGSKGWTFAHTGEPDLDRIIRFNKPIAERLCADKVEVIVNRVNVDGTDVDDPLIGQMVNLGKKSFFDGSRGAGDGYEPIVNFEFHIGNNIDYIVGETQDLPHGTGAIVISEDEAKELGVYDMQQWRQLRIESLKSLSFSPGSEGDISRNERIDKILSTGFVMAIREAVLRYSVPYPSIIDKNLSINPQDSPVVAKMKQNDIRQLLLNAEFYSYDGDGLVGRVRGTISATFTK